MATNKLKTKKHHKKQSTFKTYIYRVLKQVHPDTGISLDGMNTMIDLVNTTLSKIVDSSNILMRRTGNKMLGSREIMFAVKMSLPGELAKHAVVEGTKAVTKYNSSVERKVKGSEKAAPIPRAKRAGITFSISRTERKMMKQSVACKKRSMAAVFLAATLEYITAEVLELAGNRARDHQKIRITPRFIKLSILNDEELLKFFGDVVMSGGVNVDRQLTKKEEKEENPKKRRTSAKKTVKKSPTKKTHKETTKKSPKKKTATKKSPKKKTSTHKKKLTPKK